jgi:Arc/MetJ-type ribon-helix-helix transcriptional regulator
MASNRLLASTPLTFELPSSLVDRIHECRGRLGLKSASDVVRSALAGFDFEGFQAPPREQSQISVRLAPAQKKILLKTARQKKVSAGELLRAALEALSDGVAAKGKDRGARPAARKTARARTK